MIKTKALGSWRHVFRGQFQHILMLIMMIAGFRYFTSPSFGEGEFLGFTSSAIALYLVIAVVLHQVIGWFVFRAQLHSGLLTKVFGKYDLVAWGFVFFLLFFLRPLLSVGLGLTDSGTLPGPRSLQIGAGLALLAPVIYTIWSIHKYFGIERALGGDHFREKFRHMPLVRAGAFKYSDNAMYFFAFFIFWSIALLLGSKLALAAAAFQHAYIWVHMYCTERPDLEVIYPANTLEQEDSKSSVDNEQSNKAVNRTP